ncbi:MAG: hypothetical protein PSX80_02140 [bacterium]|nr:hypothetical protein [bacterium]
MRNPTGTVECHELPRCSDSPYKARQQLQISSVSTADIDPAWLLRPLHDKTPAAPATTEMSDFG